MLTEHYFLEDIPIVLSGSRLAQPVSETPAAITVIDREMIDASGAREIADLFRLVPGFQVGYLSGHFATVTYHGLSDEFSRRMQVLVDGRSVYNPGIGGVSWSDLPLEIDDIERIEVVRGPNAATYGANSFFGVISIITRYPFQDIGTHIKVNQGTEDIADTTLRHAGSAGDLSYRGTVALRSDEGFDDREDSKIVRLATLRTDYQIDNNDGLELQLGYSEGPRERGFDGDEIEFPHTVDNQSHFQQLRWRHVRDPYNEISLQFYHNYLKRTETRDGLLLVAPVDASAKTHRYDLELQQILGSPAGWRMVWGAGVRRDAITGRLFFGTDDTLENDGYRLFGNLEWHFSPKLIMNVGAMLENNEITGTDLSPRLAFNFHVRQNHTVRASISRALRTPVLFEDQADFRFDFVPVASEIPFSRRFVGSGELQPEEIISYELGYIAQLPAEGLSLDVKLFHDSLSELIAAQMETGTWINTDSATVSGIETQLDWRPTPRSRLLLSHAYAYVDSDNGDLERSTPDHTLGTLAIYRFTPQVTGSAAYYRVGEQLWLDTGDLVPAYDRIDLRLAYNFRYDGKSGEIALITQNVLDEYTDFRMENVFDNRTYLSLRLAF